ncbi:trypsin-like peptidase domain-containing protein [Streptomyces sp. NPDC056480]|uniref:nSTAND1 domain-containing NTPase n=1 Tax=Streptomyces sp. NPDC056480 TaxID=3345833 RepID=UPI0036AEAE05
MGEEPVPGSGGDSAKTAPDGVLDGVVGPALPAAVFQVIAADSSVAGAGFLTDDGTGFTCAHVVRAAGGAPGGQVKVVFPHLPEAPPVMAEVVAEEWRSPESDDVAVLRLDTVPEGARSVAVGVSAGCRGHRVLSFGFPVQAPQGGHFGYGEAGGLLPESDGATRLLQLTQANDLTTGFSGAPVVDELTGLVIGMVTSVASPDAHLKGLSIAYATPAEVLREVRPRLAQQQVCPYLGLEPFTGEHADWFHGRQAALERVLAALGGNRRLLMLLGPSGAGKSSLVNAGLLPALAGGALPGSDRWLTVCTRPGRDLLTQAEEDGLANATTDGLTAAVEARLAAEAGYDHLLLVVDQFEEILAQLATQREPLVDRRLQAVEQLLELVESHTTASVLLVMRNDFYAPLDALAPDLMNAVVPGLCNIPATLSRPELKEIINQPAAAVGLPLETGLADRIVDDILDSDPTARQAPATLLPALELALRQLWESRRRADGSLTHAAYERIGKVTGSLTAWCNRALGQLPPDRRTIAQRILTALVRPADEASGIPATRRTVPLARLRALAADPDHSGSAADTAVDAVLAALVHHRIVTTGTTSPPGTSAAEPSAELIHDALIRDWADLRDWVAQDHQFQVWLLRAAEQQTRYADSDLSSDLLDGSLLTEGQEWAGRRPLPSEITSFLKASRQRQQAVVRRARRINTVLAGMLALALVATGVAFHQQQTATAAQRAAQSRQLAAQSVNVASTAPDLASLLAVQAWKTSPTEEAAASLYAAPAAPLRRQLKVSEQAVKSIAFSPDGTTLAIGSDDASVRLWDAKAGKPRASLTGPSGIVISMAFSADGTAVATGDSSGWVRLWEVKTGKLRHTFKQHASGVVSVAFSPDGTSLAASSDTTAQLWDVTTSKLRRTIRIDGTKVLVTRTSVGFSPDGSAFVLTYVEDSMRLWDMRTGRPRPIIPTDRERLPDKSRFSIGSTTLAAVDGETVRLWEARMNRYLRASLDDRNDLNSAAMALGRDGITLATGSKDGAVVWDTRAGKSHAALTGQDGESRTLAFSPDGTTLATGGDNGTVRLWDVQASIPRAALTSLTKALDSVESVAFSPDGTTLATGGDGGTVRLWSVRTGKLRTTLTNRTEEVSSVVFSPDGATLAVASADSHLNEEGEGKKLWLWNVGSDSPRVTHTIDIESVRTMAYSPDGTTLATGGSRTVQLRDVKTGELRRTLTGDRGYVTSVSFSPDGNTLAVGSDDGGSDGMVRLWNTKSGNLRRTLSKGIASAQVAFSPDGSTLATSGEARSVRLWDVETGESRATLIGGPDTRVWSVAFSPDGNTLATGNSGGMVHLWDVKTGKIHTTLTAHTVDIVPAVAFSPDGATLATGDYDSTALLWNARLPGAGEIAESICRGLHRDFTKAEKAEQLRSQDFAPVCPDSQQ